MRGMVEGSVVVVVGRKDCCMTQVASRLLQGLRANLVVCEINNGSPEKMALIDTIAEMDCGDGKTLVVSGGVHWGKTGWRFVLTHCLSYLWRSYSHLNRSWCSLVLTSILL